MDARQRLVHGAATQLRELLNDKCPRCQTVFLDFTGCCALTCRRCGCGFCAWCLADCGGDAHQHVAHCPHNLAPGRNLFATEAQWEEGRRQRRQQAVTALLSGLPRDVARSVVEATQGELADVGLQAVAAAFLA